MTQREDGIQVLGEREQQELADRLMTFLGSRPSGKVTALRWDEIGSQFPALAAYTPQTLQFYTGLCDDLGLLRGFYDDGEVFPWTGSAASEGFGERSSAPCSSKTSATGCIISLSALPSA